MILLQTGMVSFAESVMCLSVGGVTFVLLIFLFLAFGPNLDV